jgi:hypothetical protein
MFYVIHWFNMFILNAHFGNNHTVILLFPFSLSIDTIAPWFSVSYIITCVFVYLDWTIQYEYLANVCCISYITCVLYISIRHKTEPFNMNTKQMLILLIKFHRGSISWFAMMNSDSLWWISIHYNDSLFKISGASNCFDNFVMI